MHIPTLRFYSVGVIRRDDGVWRDVELGDGVFGSQATIFAGPENFVAHQQVVLPLWTFLICWAWQPLQSCHSRDSCRPRDEESP